MAFRRQVNDYVAAHMYDNVIKTFTAEYLPLYRCRSFARKTRDYLKVYKDMSLITNAPTQSEKLDIVRSAYNGKLSVIPAETFKDIETMLKLKKAHRNILDLAQKTINSI